MLKIAISLCVFFALAANGENEIDAIMRRATKYFEPAINRSRSIEFKIKNAFDGYVENSRMEIRNTYLKGYENDNRNGLSQGVQECVENLDTILADKLAIAIVNVSDCATQSSNRVFRYLSKVEKKMHETVNTFKSLSGAFQQCLVDFSPLSKDATNCQNQIVTKAMEIDREWIISLGPILTKLYIWEQYYIETAFKPCQEFNSAAHFSTSIGPDIDNAKRCIFQAKMNKQ